MGRKLGRRLSRRTRATVGAVTVALYLNQRAPTHGGMSGLLSAQITVENRGASSVTIEPVSMKVSSDRGDVAFGPVEALLDRGGGRAPMRVRGRSFSIVRGVVRLVAGYRGGLAYGVAYQQRITLRVNGTLVELVDNPLQFRAPISRR